MANGLIKEQRYPELISFSQNLTYRESLFYSGRAYLGLGQFSEALEYFSKLNALAPTSDTYHWLALATAGTIESKGMLKQIRLTRDMVSYLRKSLQLNPENTESKYLLGKFLTTAPGLLGGDLAEARVLQSELQDRDPLYGKMLGSYIAQEEGQAELAEEMLVSALMGNPEFKEAYERLSMACEDSQSGGYVNYLMALVKKFPNGKYPNYYLGLNYVGESNYVKAFELFTRISENHAEFAAAWYQLGKLCYVWDRYPDKGLAAFEKFLSLPSSLENPTHADAYWRMGLIHLRLKDKARAKWYFEKSLSLDEDHAGARNELEKLN